MESNNDNNNYGEGQQLRSSPRKRKLNELANNGQPAAATEEEQKQNQPHMNLSKKKRENGNDDLEIGSLSHEDLVNLVQKLLLEKNEAQTQLETIKKEAEESASRQAEEFFQRNIQLEQGKAEVDVSLHKNLIEIAELHKEVEQKSGELTEKAKQIDALLVQLNESREQHQIITTEQQMKIQLSLETWYDMLAFVPRHRLGKVVPILGDRRFASIVQKFLHKYGEITIDHIEIVAPYEEDPSGHPRVRAWQNNRPLRFEMAEAQMPPNIKNFNKFELSYFDQSVLNFMRKFKKNGLLDNVHLEFAKLPSKEIVQPVLCHILPLINGIVSIDLANSAQLVDIYDAGKSKEIYELNMKMMEAKFLAVRWDSENLHANQIDLYCRWLYQTARPDGKPRMLLLGRFSIDYSPISVFIDRLKKDFQMATDPVTFVIRIFLPKAFQPQEDICLENGKTKERLLTKMEETVPNLKLLQISRYPPASTKKSIMGKEVYGMTIYLTKELKVVAI